MYQSIDEGSPEKFEGFAWRDRDGETEYLKLYNFGTSTFSLVNSVDDSARFFKKDISKLIRALQLAEQHFLKGN